MHARTRCRHVHPAHLLAPTRTSSASSAEQVEPLFYLLHRQPRGVLRRQRADEAARERTHPAASCAAPRPMALRRCARERSLGRETRPESLAKDCGAVVCATPGTRRTSRAYCLYTAGLGRAAPQRTVDRRLYGRRSPQRAAAGVRVLTGYSQGTHRVLGVGDRRSARCGRGQGTHGVLTGYSGSAVTWGGAHLASTACRSVLTPACAARTCKRRMSAPPSRPLSTHSRVRWVLQGTVSTVSTASTASTACLEDCADRRVVGRTRRIRHACHPSQYSQYPQCPKHQQYPAVLTAPTVLCDRAIGHRAAATRLRRARGRRPRACSRAT
jgi:hypothetical protein